MQSEVYRDRKNKIIDKGKKRQRLAIETYTCHDCELASDILRYGMYEVILQP